MPRPFARRCLLAALLAATTTLAAAGCGRRLQVAAPGTRAPDEAVAPLAPADDEPEPVEAGASVEPLRVPVGPTEGEAERVGWLQDAEGRFTLPPQAELWLRSNVGRDVGLVRVGPTVLVIDRDEGVLGAARVGETTWYGVLADDTILVSVNRDLYRADVAGAIAGDWEYLGAYGDAIAWDAAGEHFVLATPWAVWRSSDGGRTFDQVLAAPSGQEFVNTEVRADGVIAALTYESGYVPHMHVSADGGTRWTESPLPLPALDRVGARLQYSDPNGCSWALSEDASSWVRSDTWDASTSWALLGLVAPRPRWRSSAILARIDEPAAPRATKDALVAAPADGVMRCTDPGRADDLEPLGPMPASLPGTEARWFAQSASEGASAGDCALGGLGCLVDAAGPLPLAGRSDYAFLSDGVCTPDAAGDCASPQRLPTPVRWNRETSHLELLELPAGCEVPLEAFGARGLGVMACRSGGERVSIFVASDREGWAQELEVAAEGRIGWAQAADGTLALYTECPQVRGLCGVWVRSAVPVGQAEAWRALAIDDLVALRLLAGGRVLAVTSPEAAAQPRGAEPSGRAAFTLALHEAGEAFWGERFVLLDAVRLDTPVHGLEVAPDGRILLVAEQGGARREHVATRDGMLHTSSAP